MIKKSVIIGKRKTSVSMEEEFWSALGVIADRKGVTWRTLICELAGDKKNFNLASAIRVYALANYKPTGTPQK